MTKKTFIALADAIKLIEDAELREKVAKLIGNVCAGYNPRFNWNTWNDYIK